ncbi:MAG: hypothetical protein Q7W05_11135, partial [Deltaproteobacteria bacterium]|nr:hypothetical protein [Deltaproteobacteria bacterium]
MINNSPEYKGSSVTCHANCHACHGIPEQRDKRDIPPLGDVTLSRSMPQVFARELMDQLFVKYRCRGGGVGSGRIKQPRAWTPGPGLRPERPPGR